MLKNIKKQILIDIKGKKLSNVLKEIKAFIDEQLTDVYVYYDAEFDYKEVINHLDLSSLIIINNSILVHKKAKTADDGMYISIYGGLLEKIHIDLLNDKIEINNQ